MFADGPSRGKFCAGIEPFGTEIESASVACEMHVRLEIRRGIKNSRRDDGNGLGRVQREKINAGHAVMMNIGADIQFEEGRESGDRGQMVETHAAHRKWRHADPRLVIERVNFKLIWDQ